MVLTKGYRIPRSTNKNKPMAESKAPTNPSTEATPTTPPALTKVKLKVKLVFKAVGSAPILATSKVSVAAGQHFAVVDNFLRGQLKLGQHDTLFLYIKSGFCPSMDEIMSTLIESFGEGTGTKRKLIVNYSLQPAWG